MKSAASMTGSLFKTHSNYRLVRKTQSQGHHPALLHAVMWLAHSWAGNRKSEENRGALQVLLTHTHSEEKTSLPHITHTV